MKILAAYENVAFSKPIEYTLRFCLNALGVRGEIASYDRLGTIDISAFALMVTYGKNPARVSSVAKATKLPALHISESDFFSEKNYLAGRLPLQRPLLRLGDVPILFSADKSPEAIVRSASEKRTELAVDVIATIFFFVSRYEEFVSEERDEHGRFAAASSLAHAEGFLDRPIVNEYLGVLRSALADLCPEIGVERRWDGNDFCSVISFDVDAAFKYGRWWFVSLPGGIFRWRKGLREVLRSAIEASKVAVGNKPDPYFVFDSLLEQQRRYSATATYYFLSERTSRWDVKPQIERKAVRMLLGRLKEAGCEIGLHGSYASGEDAEQLRREKARLERVSGGAICGVRQHFLRLRVPQTWRAQERAGLRYDATLGFADAEGFRAGVCLPYRPFDLEQKCERTLWVVPLCVMDATLKHYRRYSPAEAQERIFTIIDAVKRHRGVFTLLWHNSSFDETEWRGWREVFERTVRYLAAQGTLFLTAEQLIERMEKAIASP